MSQSPFSVEKLYFSLITSKKKNLLTLLLLAVLRLVSLLYRFFVFIKNIFYDFHIKKPLKTSVPVISIGNISLGGTGKTPLTLQLSQEISISPIAIASRGYKSSAEKGNKPLIISSAEAQKLSFKQIGDEPLLFANNLPDAFLAIGKNRCYSAQQAEHYGAKLLILDDGMQHRRLARDIEIVVVDSKKDLDQQHLFPRGLLREGLKSLKRADVIIANHCDKESYFSFQQQIKKYSQAPIIAMKPTSKGLYTLQNKKAPSLKKRSIALFCSIGNPESFKLLIKNSGGILVAKKILRDHIAIDIKTLQEFALESQRLGATALLCTEKDAVRLPKDLPPLALPIEWLAMRLKVTHGQNHWQNLINTINHL